MMATHLTKIHCYSCGHDTVSEFIHQKTGKPIKRCSICHSLNFRALNEDVSAVESLEEYKPVLDYVLDRKENDYEKE